jgi:hypothetical protein
VEIIGSGASFIQTLPNMQPYVKHIDVYFRNAVWFISIAGNNGAGEVYTPEQREEFRSDPKALVKHAKCLEDQINGLYIVIRGRSWMQMPSTTQNNETSICGFYTIGTLSL